MKRKEKVMKIKNKFKFSKLFLYTSLNLFSLFTFLNNFKKYKFFY